MSVENGFSLLDELRLERAFAGNEKDEAKDWLQSFETHLLQVEGQLVTLLTPAGEGGGPGSSELLEWTLVVSSHCCRHRFSSQLTRQLARGILNKMAAMCGCASFGELLEGRRPRLKGQKTSPYHRSEDEEKQEEEEEEEEETEVRSARQETRHEKQEMSVDTFSSRQEQEVLRNKQAVLYKEQEVLRQEQEVLYKEQEAFHQEQEVEAKTPELEAEKQESVLPEGPERPCEQKCRTDVCVDSSADHVTVTCSDQQLTNGLLPDLLARTRETLTASEWKARPTHKHAFLWCLLSLRHPHLAPHLRSLMPPLLMLVDDYEVQHKVWGLQALTHLTRNVDASEMRWHGQALVIHQAISNLIYNNDIEIINAYHLCSLRLLPLLEGPPRLHPKDPKSRSFTDDVFDKLLASVEMESKTPPLQALTRHLTPYIHQLGVGVVRHLPRLLKMAAGCMKHSDHRGELTRLNCLRALHTAMTVGWLRVPPHRDDILKSLLMLIVDCCHGDRGEVPDPGTPDGKVLTSVVQCLITLQRICQDLESTMAKLESECDHLGLRQCVVAWKSELGQRTGL